MLVSGYFLACRKIMSGSKSILSKTKVPLANADFHIDSETVFFYTFFNFSFLSSYTQSDR